jgi:hypothetical protein
VETSGVPASVFIALLIIPNNSSYFAITYAIVSLYSAHFLVNPSTASSSSLIFGLTSSLIFFANVSLSVVTSLTLFLVSVKSFPTVPEILCVSASQS